MGLPEAITPAKIVLRQQFSDNLECPPDSDLYAQYRILQLSYHPADNGIARGNNTCETQPTMVTVNFSG